MATIMRLDHQPFFGWLFYISCIISGRAFLCESPYKLLFGIYGGIHIYGIPFYFKGQWDVCSFSVASYGAWGKNLANLFLHANANKPLLFRMFCTALYVLSYNCYFLLLCSVVCLMSVLFVQHSVWLDDAFDRAKQLYLSYYRSIPKSLERSTAHKLMVAMMDGDERFIEPTPKSLEKLTLQSVKGAVMNQFVGDNMEVCHYQIEGIVLLAFHSKYPI